MKLNLLVDETRHASQKIDANDSCKVIFITNPTIEANCNIKAMEDSENLAALVIFWFESKFISESQLLSSNDNREKQRFETLDMFQ